MNKRLGSPMFLLSMLVILLVGIAAINEFHSLSNWNPINLFLDRRPVTAQPTNIDLSVSSPNNNTLVFDPNILIEGRTTPKAKILISTESHDQVTVSQTGNFSSTVNLDPGINTLIITSFDTKGNSKTEERIVFYSKDKI